MKHNEFMTLDKNASNKGENQRPSLYETMRKIPSV